MKLTYKFKFAYGLSEVFTNLTLFMVLSYELVFLTSVCGINTYLVGVIMTIGSVIDAASALFIGPIIERSNLKWGRYRSWLLICFPLSIFFVLLFTDYTSLIKSNIVLVILYIALHAIQAVFTNITYITRYNFNASLTADTNERMNLSRLRQGGAAVGSYIGGYLYLGLIYFFGHSSDLTSKGFFWTAFVIGIGLILGYMLLFKVSKQYSNTGIKIDDKGMPETLSTVDMYKLAFKEKDMICMIAAEFFRFLSKSMLLTLAPLFFTHVCGDLNKWSIYYSFSAIAVLIGALVAGPLNKKLSTKAIYIFCVLGSAVLFFGMFLSSGNATIAIICAVAGNMILAPTDCLYPVIFAEINDSIISKHNKSARSVVYALMSLSCEVAYLISYSICTFGLALVGFQANLPVTSAVITGIKYIAVGFPTVSLIIAAIFAFFYQSDIKKTKL